MPHGQLSIRQYVEEDRTQVVALWRDVFSDDPVRNEPNAVIDRKLDVQRELFLVGEVGGRIIATVLGGYDGFRGWIYHLAVDPSYRRLGHGQSLVRAAEDGMRDLGCIKVNLQVRGTNTSVITFYEELGYTVENNVGLGRMIV